MKVKNIFLLEVFDKKLHSVALKLKISQMPLMQQGRAREEMLSVVIDGGFMFLFL